MGRLAKESTGIRPKDMAAILGHRSRGPPHPPPPSRGGRGEENCNHLLMQITACGAEGARKLQLSPLAPCGRGVGGEGYPIGNRRAI